jgi:hypothetical protein
MTDKERILNDLTLPWQIEIDLKDLLDFLCPKFFNIKEKGKKEWNDEAEGFVLTEVLKEGVNMFYQSKLLRELKDRSRNYSTDHLLVANPSQFQKLFPEFGLDDENFGEE